MRRRPVLSLLPLLSVFVGAMGVLAFLTLALALVQARPDPQLTGAQVHVQLSGAPARAAPVPLECRGEGVTIHESGNQRFFPLERLRREVAIVRDLHDRSASQAGGPLTREQEWLFYKAVIERDPRLKGSLTLALHQIEMANLKGDPRSGRRELYPVLLVAPDGLSSYDVTAFLLDATSRLPVAVEPMLTGWSVAAMTDGPASLAATRLLRDVGVSTDLGRGAKP
jgi:hypothetical protein